jgi:hypothetical protein
MMNPGLTLRISPKSTRHGSLAEPLGPKRIGRNRVPFVAPDLRACASTVTNQPRFAEAGRIAKSLFQ